MTRSEPPVRPRGLSDIAEPAPGLLARRRLLDMLGSLRPLTLVSAPAGYGKSALVESWAARPGLDATLVRSSLEDVDVAPEVLWPSVHEALRLAGVLIRNSGVPGLGDGDRSLVKALAADIAAHGRRVVWILDCGEFSLSAPAGREVDRLIRAADGALAVLMLTRHDPPLPLHRLRLEGALREVRAHDLAFTPGEVAALMKGEGLELTPSEVGALRTRTGGWPAGLRFAAMALRGRADVRGAIEDFRGDTGNVAEYLMSEVLAQQPPAQRRFLLRSCIAEELDPPLVEALTGQRCDLQVLQAMADGDCFVERIPGRHDRFRYHALFRQFLRAQLWFEKSPPPEVLHQVAARWLARDGQWLRAVSHAVAATDWPLATSLLVDSLGFVELLTGQRGRWLTSLSVDLRPALDGLDGVDAALTRATLALADLDVTAAGIHLDVAREALARESAPAPQPRRVAVAVLAALHGSMTVGTGTGLEAALHSVLLAEKALRPLSALGQPSLGPHLAAVVAGCKGRVLFARGEFLGAAEAFHDGVRSAESTGLHTVAAELRGMSALVDAVTGHLQRASATAVAASHTNVASTTHPVRRTSEAAKLALAWVRTEEAEPLLAHELLAQAGREQASYDSLLLGAVACLLRARLVADQGDPRLALLELRAALEDLRLPDDADPATASGCGDTFGNSWLARTLLLTQADALTRLGRPRDAVAVVRTVAEDRLRHELDVEVALQQALVAAGDPARDLARLTTARHRTSYEDHPLSLEVARWLVLTQGSIADGDASAAVGFLGQALRAAAPEHLRRPILQAPDEVQELLTASGLADRNRWLTVPSDAAGSRHHGIHIPEQSHGPDAHRTPAPVVPLTKKETEVLGYLAKLLTTDEIAAVMVVSVNTVRSHVRSILRKLGVPRRNDAVRRAWELQLVPPDSAA